MLRHLPHLKEAYLAFILIAFSLALASLSGCNEPVSRGNPVFSPALGPSDTNHAASRGLQAVTGPLSTGTVVITETPYPGVMIFIITPSFVGTSGPEAWYTPTALPPGTTLQPPRMNPPLPPLPTWDPRIPEPPTMPVPPPNFLPPQPTLTPLGIVLTAIAERTLTPSTPVTPALTPVVGTPTP